MREARTIRLAKLSCLSTWCVTLLLASRLMAYDIVISAANAYPEGVGVANFQVTMVGCTFPQTDAMLEVNVMGITATEGVDMGLPIPELLSLGESGLSQMVQVPITQDSEIEYDETFELIIESAGNSSLICQEGVLNPNQPIYQELATIVDDDGTPEPAVAVADVSISEGDSGITAASFQVSLTPPPESSVSVTANTRDGSATTADGDYVANIATLVFGPGQATGEFVVEINGDLLVEPDEDFFVDLTNPMGVMIVDGEARGTIVDDDSSSPPTTPTLAIDSVRVVEGDSGATRARFTVGLSPAQEVTVTVQASTRDGSANSGSDYQPQTQTVVFPPGATSMPFDVDVLGDTQVEEDETFFVDLMNPDGADLQAGSETGTGTIVDDDVTNPPPTQSALRIDDVVLDEGDSGTRNATFTVTLDPPSMGEVAVGFRTENGSARVNQDYLSRSGSLHFAPGQTAQSLSVPVIGETLIENDEIFFVVLEGAAGATIADGSGRATIRNDDDARPPATVELRGDGNQKAGVGDEVVIEVLVTRDGEPASGVEVTWGIEGDASPVGGSTSTSGEDGIARLTVRLGSSPGNVTVTAQLPNGGSAQVVIEVSRPLAPLFPGQPVEQGVAQALDLACASGDLGGLCRYLFSLSDSDARQAISELSPREASALGRLSLEGMHNQLDNIDNHLAAVRRSGRLGASRVALGLGDRSWEPGELWRIARGESSRGFSAIDGALSLLPNPRTEANLAPRDGDQDPGLAGPSRAAIFASGRLSTGERDGSATEEGFEFDTTGFTVGFDYRAGPGLVLGLAAGYLDTATDFGGSAGNTGDLDVEGYSATGFLTRYGDRGYLDLIASWGSNDYTLLRHVDLPVPFAGSNRHSIQGAPSGDQTAVSLTFGADWGSAASFGLFGGISWVDASIDAFSEAGGGPAALVLEKQSLESLLGEVGFEFSYASSRSWGVFLPQLRVAYLNEFEDDARLIRGRFALDPNGHEFVIPTEVNDSSYLDVGIGFTATFKRGRSFYLFWETDLERDDLESSHFTGGFRLEL